MISIENFLKESLEIIQEKGEAFEVFKKTEEIMQKVDSCDFEEKDHKTLILMLVDEYAHKHDVKASEYIRDILLKAEIKELIFNE